MEIEAVKGDEDDTNQQGEPTNKNVDQAPDVDTVQPKVDGEIGGPDE